MLEALLRLLPLDALPRTGWIQAGIGAPESIAGHVLGTAHLALALAPRVEPGLDLGRVLGLVLVHDVPEALSGDLPRAASQALPAGAKRAMEDQLAAELLTPMGGEALWQEYQEQATREARFARLCDKLQLGVRLVGYERSGSAGLEDFRAGLEGLDASEFAPARDLLDEILRSLR